MDVPIESCVSAKIYKTSFSKRIFWLSAIVAAYAISLPYAYFTAGEPREAAIVRAQELEDEKWALELNETVAAVEISSLSSVGSAENETISPVDAQSAEAFSSLKKAEEPEMTEEEFEELLANTPPISSGWFSSWSLTEDQKKIKRYVRIRTEKLHKKLKAAAGGEDIVLPPWYLPSAWACLALFLTLTAHALFHLLCLWLVEFKALALLNPVKGPISVGDVVLIKPPANRGKAEFAEVQRAAITGDLKVDFQRQSYTYSPPERLGQKAQEYKNGIFFLATSPVSLPIGTYLHAKGFKSDTDVARAQELWGKNHLSLPPPSFVTLLKEQLTRPLAIFQVFCALLWLLDEYWTYTLWTLGSVVVFEAVTVFQRTKTQNMLGGMAPKPSSLYVFRCGRWILLTSKDLLPGDIISVAYKSKAVKVVQGEKPAPSASNLKADVVPCDCLLLTGSAVSNEASLTGESVPQMKEALLMPAMGAEGFAEEKLDITGVHRVNTLFSGTTLVTVDGVTHRSIKGGSLGAAGEGIPMPPDNGAVAYVLRTGFSSSQGNLLQMIEFSQQTVSGDSRETGLALLMLLCFALVASGYVLKEGLRKKEKTTHEILLKCVIIITSVVPRQLPMQMAMAVNMALMALMKSGIFCTEPFRVPLAGRISNCLFDKTGTLTTDQLVPVGIVNVKTGSETVRTLKSLESEEENADASKALSKVRDADDEAAMVLAACHSLVVVDNDDDAETEEAAAGTTGSSVPAPVTEAKKQGPQLAGDPIELAAIKGVEWTWDAQNSIARPGAWESMEKAVRILETRLANAKKEAAAPRPQGAPPLLQGPRSLTEVLPKQITELQQKIKESKERAMLCKYSGIRVVQRHYFSSGLQRMSVVCRVSTGKSDYTLSSSGNDKESPETWYCLVKGSPEAVRSLLVSNSAPDWYDECYGAMARKGLRVLALAYRKVNTTDLNDLPPDASPSSMPREWVESGLTFAGFISFECKIRADSPVVISALRESDHKVAMLTGDSPLTSVHVAKEVNICTKGKSVCVLTTNPPGSSSNLGEKATPSLESLNARWVFRRDDGSDEAIPFVLGKQGTGSVTELAKSFDLVTTEADFMAILDATSGQSCASDIAEGTLDLDKILAVDNFSLWHDVEHFRVFARMSPQGKRYIISALQKVGKNFGAHVLMCGDGGNDVGALKQADVGIALLAGHANANTTEKIEGAGDKAVAMIDGNNPPVSTSAEDALNDHDKALKARSAHVNKLREAHMKVWQAQYMKKAQEEMQAKIKELTEKGELMATFGLMKEQAGKTRMAVQAENQRFMALHGQIWDPKNDVDHTNASQGDLMSMFGIDPSQTDSENMGGNGPPIVRPGDASVAAPFTSKVPSVRAVVDLIRQGRCTLLSALMQQQIMMLESTIAAYTLSALSLHNARSSERQMMASSWLIMTAAVAFSYASPVDKMHPQRPLSSLFHPAIIISILGQAAIHIACMSLAVQWATDAMGPEALKEVTEFFKKAKAKQLDSQTLCDEDDIMCNFNLMWQAPFLPNLLNSVVFLVETSQMISVFFANYKGRPWMKGMLENHPLFLSVFLCIAGVVVASWEMVPQLNEAIQLAPFPNDAFRYKVVALVVATIAGTFCWDRFCTFMFAPKVFRAMMDEASKTSLKDLYPVLMTLLKIIGGVLLLGTGNILLWGLTYYVYRQYSQKQQQIQQQAALGG